MSVLLGDRHPLPNVPIYSRGEAPPMERWFKNLFILMPAYVNGGNSSFVALTTGEMFYVLWRTQSMRTKLLQHSCISQQDLRRACEQDLNVSLHTPLVFPSENIAFAALKVRKPIDRNDGADGFFRIDTFDHVHALTPHTCQLHLQNDMTVHIEMSRERIVFRTRNARSSLILFKSRGEPYPL